MARYGSAIYGTSTYGSIASKDLSAEPIYATPYLINASDGTFTFSSNGVAIYDTIYVTWLKPDNADADSSFGNKKWVLLRSNAGIPISHNDTYSTVLSYEDNTGVFGGTVANNFSDDVSRSRRIFTDSKLIIGKEYYYAVYAYSNGDWFLVGSATANTVKDHQSLNTLISSLPAHWTNEYRNEISLLDDVDLNNPLVKWMSAFAFSLDQTMTKARMVKSMWDPFYTPSAFLQHAVNQFGIYLDGDISDESYRALLTNVNYIAKNRGTKAALTPLVKGVALAPVSITYGGNLIKDMHTSSFEDTTGIWYTKYGACSVADLSSESNSYSEDVFIGSGGVVYSRVARQQADDSLTKRQKAVVSFLSGRTTEEFSMGIIPVASLTESTNSVVVVTSLPHGLVTGDYVLDSHPTVSLTPGGVAKQVVVLSNTSFSLAYTGASTTNFGTDTDHRIYGGETASIILKNEDGFNEFLNTTTTYRFSIQAKNNGDITKSAILNVRLYHQILPTIIKPSSSVSLGSTASGGGWKNITVDVDVPNAYSIADMSLALTSSSAVTTPATQQVFVDNASVFKLSYLTGIGKDGVTGYYEPSNLLNITIDTTNITNSDYVVLKPIVEAAVAKNIPTGTAFRILT